jgi:hypothetical protein
VEKYTQQTLEQAKQLKEQFLNSQVISQVWAKIQSWLSSVTWFLPFLGPIVAILLLLIFEPCLFNLQVRFVSSHLEFIKLQMTVHVEPQFHQSHLNWPKSPLEKLWQANQLCAPT